MLKQLIALCAESVVRDAETNSVSVHTIIEDIQAPTFPVVFPRLAYFTLLGRDPGDADAVRGEAVIALNDREIGRVPVEINFQGKARSRLFLSLRGVPITETGALRVWLETGGRRQCEWQINVTQRTEQEALAEARAIASAS